MKRFICAAVVTVAIAGTGLAAGAIAPQNQGLRSGTGAFAAYRGPGASAPIARRLANPGRRLHRRDRPARHRSTSVDSQAACNPMSAATSSRFRAVAVWRWAVAAVLGAMVLAGLGVGIAGAAWRHGTAARPVNAEARA